MGVGKWEEAERGGRTREVVMDTMEEEMESDEYAVIWHTPIISISQHVSLS